jgi:hypothetical protein
MMRLLMLIFDDGRACWAGIGHLPGMRAVDIWSTRITHAGKGYSETGSIDQMDAERVTIIEQTR